MLLATRMMGKRTVSTLRSSNNQSGIRYKRDAINGELYRARKIANDFEKEKNRIRKKFLDVGFPSRFIESVIRNFTTVSRAEEVNIIPDWLFEDRKVPTVRLPFCP